MKIGTIISIGIVALAAWAPVAQATPDPYVYQQTPVTIGGYGAFVTGAATGTLATGSYSLEAVVVGTGATGAWIRLWDSTSTSGATISDIAATDSGTTVWLPRQLTNGLTYQTSGAASISIFWQ